MCKAMASEVHNSGIECFATCVVPPLGPGQPHPRNPLYPLDTERPARDSHHSLARLIFRPDEVVLPYYPGNDDEEEEEDRNESKGHAFSQLLLTEPKVLSLRLRVDTLGHGTTTGSRSTSNTWIRTRS